MLPRDSERFEHRLAYGLRPWKMFKFDPMTKITQKSNQRWSKSIFKIFQKSDKYVLFQKIENICLHNCCMLWATHFNLVLTSFHHYITLEDNLTLRLSCSGLNCVFGFLILVRVHFPFPDFLTLARVKFAFTKKHVICMV